MSTENAETLPAVQKPKHMGIAIPTSQTYEPRSYAEAKAMAVELAASDIIPKDYQRKPANVLVAMMFGKELGYGTMQSLQSIMVVNGRPSQWGDIVMGSIKASSVYESSEDSFDNVTMTATFTVKRKNEKPLTRTFSKDDAEKAGLWKKEGPWQNYPKRMLFQRARAFALRDAFPDVLKGLHIAEEEMGIIDVTPIETDHAMPQRASQAAAAPVEAQVVPPAAAPVDEPAKQEAAAPAESVESNEPKQVTIKVASVAKSKTSLDFHILGKDGVDYVTTDEKLALAVKKIAGTEEVAVIEYTDGVGCRIVSTLRIP